MADDSYSGLATIIQADQSFAVTVDYAPLEHPRGLKTWRGTFACLGDGEPAPGDAELRLEDGRSAAITLTSAILGRGEFTGKHTPPE